MSMAYPQPANNKTAIVLITIGVVVASLVELVAVGAAYIFVIGSIFANQINKLDQFNAAQADARDNTRQVASRPSPTPSWNPPKRTSTSPPPTPSTDHPGTLLINIRQVNVNDRVYIYWGSNWYPGTVIERGMNQNEDKVKIHYDGHDNSWDEFADVHRLRRMSPSDPKYRNGTQIASTPANATPSRTSTPSNTPPSTNPAPSSTADLNPRNLSAPYNSRHQPQDTVVREWRNRKGEVIFRGQLYANFGPAVRLVQRSGFSLNSIPVDASLLSDEDQAYANKFPEVSPDRPDPGDEERDQRRKEMEQRMQEMRDRAMQRSGISPPGNAANSSKPSADADADSIKGMRTWKDATGKFDLQAELIGVENGNVKLQRPDGKIVTMPIDKLSAADRDAVRAKYPGQ